MLSRLLFTGAAALAMLALASRAQAQDTHRLALPASTDAGTFDLKATDADLEADTINVGRGGGRGGGGGGRGVAVRGGGFRGGFYGGRAVAYRGGGYRGVGYRGLGYGYRGVGYRGYGYRGYGYRGYGYRGYGYRGYGYGGYYPWWGLGSYWWPGYGYGYYPYYSNYYPSTYYVYPSDYDYPTGLSTVIPSMPPAGTSLYTTPPPAAQPPAGTGTFEYDGGPRLPVPLPLPKGEEKLTRLPNHPMLVSDLAVSAKSGKWNYPAYGEKPTRTPRYGVQPSLIVGTLP
jgi:hypothetical protein